MPSRLLAALLLLASAEALAAPSVLPGLRERLQADGRARVILNLADPLPPSAPARQREAAVAAAQQRLLERLPPGELRLLRRYRRVPALAGVLTARGLALLERAAPPELASVQLDGPVRAHLAESVPAIHADQVQAPPYGFTGAGITVAVLDSGIFAAHPDFQEGGQSIVLAQHCFTQADCPDGAGGLASEGNLAPDDNGHGTNVSGIIASRGQLSGSHTGFAPAARLVEVKVLDQNEGGFISDFVSGMDWVLQQQATLPVQVLNMSLGSNTLYGDAASCDQQQPATASAVAQLVAQGVMVFASSGNQGSSTSIASPACNTGTVAVGAVYDSDVGSAPDYTDAGVTWHDFFGGSWPNTSDPTTSLSTVTGFTNSNARLDLLAPGAWITASGVDNSNPGSPQAITISYAGTSQASPTAAGVAALLRQAAPSASSDALIGALKATGVSTVDAKNGLSFPRIDALAALLQADPCAGQSDGTACDDGNPNTSPDACASGICVGTPLPTTSSSSASSTGSAGSTGGTGSTGSTGSTTGSSSSAGSTGGGGQSLICQACVTDSDCASNFCGQSSFTCQPALLCADSGCVQAGGVCLPDETCDCSGGSGSTGSGATGAAGSTGSTSAASTGASSTAGSSTSTTGTTGGASTSSGAGTTGGAATTTATAASSSSGASAGASTTGGAGAGSTAGAASTSAGSTGSDAGAKKGGCSSAAGLDLLSGLLAALALRRRARR